MAYNYEYPYFDTGNFNSDWLIHKMKELEETVIGLETFKYIGENEILDLNQQQKNSIAAFTSNFNVLNAPISNVQRVTVTYGSATAYIQQLYDLSNFTVYTRNYSTASGWTAWKLTQNAPGTVISTDKHLTTGDFNTLPDNKALFLYTNAMQHAPVNGYGYLITWKSTNDAAKIQVFFSTDHGFIYLRGFSGTSWSSWVEANHLDLTSYMSLTSSGGGLKAIPNNSFTSYLYRPEENSHDTLRGAYMCINGSSVFGISSYGKHTGRLITMSNSGYATLQLHNNPGYAFSSLSDLEAESQCFMLNASDSPVSGYMTALKLTRSTNEAVDGNYLLLSWDGDIYTALINNGHTGQWHKFMPVTSRALVAMSYPDSVYMGEGYKNEPNYTIYSEIPYICNTISLPGQSLLHSDEGKQSFKDAILAADLSDTDVVMTNLEMRDMDIPLDTIVEEVQSLAEAITAKNPMCELTLLSIPPVDIARWGDELLDYTMPNGSNIRQLDDRLFRLSEDNAFTYVSFEYFYNAQNTNLLKYRGDDLKTNKQYLRRVGTFIKRKM